MTDYMILTDHGDELCSGIQTRDEAVRIAQIKAGNTGRRVWVTQRHGGAEQEPVTPDGWDDETETVRTIEAAIRDSRARQEAQR